MLDSDQRSRKQEGIVIVSMDEHVLRAAAARSERGMVMQRRAQLGRFEATGTPAELRQFDGFETRVSDSDRLVDNPVPPRTKGEDR